MKRKEFLRNTALGIALPSFINGISLKAYAAHPLIKGLQQYLDEDRVLVLIQLAGGNDGINTVIPFDQYGAYKSARTNIALPEDKLLHLNGVDKTVLHPSLTEMQHLYNDGKLGIIQSVSYPKPNFSHFRATDIWMTGCDSDKVLTTGWAGRFLNTQYPDFPNNYPNTRMPDPLAIQVGSVVSETFQGPAFPMGLAISNPNSFYNLLEDKTNNGSNSRWGEQLEFIEMMSLKTDQYADTIKKAALKVPKQTDKYPAAGKNPLADQLKIVARLIAGGLQTKIYMVNTGSFDTHARQTDVNDNTSGTHANLLKRVSESIGAFMNDLEFLQIENRVMGLTFSEFGRRIKSNASGGTDHGAAAPMFYFGGKVKSAVIGANPVIPEAVTVNDNVAMQYDFRSVYSTILQNWFKLQSSDTRNILNNDFPVLPIV